MENLRDLMQVKLIFTYILCLRLLGHEANYMLTKFSGILFRKSTFKTTFIILYGTAILIIFINFCKISLGKLSLD